MNESRKYCPHCGCFLEVLEANENNAEKNNQKAINDIQIMEELDLSRMIEIRNTKLEIERKMNDLNDLNDLTKIGKKFFKKVKTPS